MDNIVKYPTVQGLGAGIGTFIVLGAVSDLIPNPVFLRMVPRTALDYLFLTLTSVLAGVYIWQRTSLKKESADYAATGGALGGFLAFGCPICNKVLLLLLGATTTMTVFNPLRPFIGALSVLMFAGVIYRQRRVRCQACD